MSFSRLVLLVALTGLVLGTCLELADGSDLLGDITYHANTEDENPLADTTTISATSSSTILPILTSATVTAGISQTQQPVAGHHATTKRQGSGFWAWNSSLYQKLRPKNFFTSSQKDGISDPIANLKEAVEQIKAEYTTLQRRSKQLERQVQKYQTTIEAQKKEIEEVISRNSALQQKMDTMSKQHAAKVRTMDDQHKKDLRDLHEMRANYEAKQKNIENLLNENATLQTEKSRLDSVVQKASTDHTKLRYHVEQLKLQLQNTETTTRDQQQELDAVNSQNSALQREVAGLREQLATVQHAREQDQGEHRQLEAAFVAKKHAFDALHRLYSALQTEKTNLNTALQKAYTERNELQHNAEQLQESIEKYEDIVVNQQQHVVRVNKINSELTDHIANVEHELEVLKGRFAKFDKVQRTIEGGMDFLQNYSEKAKNKITGFWAEKSK